MNESLPLFPLNTVLFPDAHLPLLHIFEQRYRGMIGACLEANTPFGVVLIREPERLDTDPDVTFHSVGTAAIITDHVALDDGRYLINATGGRRFKIERLREQKPYAVASVTYLPPSAEDEAAKTAAQNLLTLYHRYWSMLVAATGYSNDVETPPLSPNALSNWLGHRVQVENRRKQRWLEADLGTRMREISAALEAEIALLPTSTDATLRPADRMWIGPGSWN